MKGFDPAEQTSEDTYSSASKTAVAKRDRRTEAELRPFHTCVIPVRFPLTGARSTTEATSPLCPCKNGGICEGKYKAFLMNLFHTLCFYGDALLNPSRISESYWAN